ncbi:dihydroorotate dehydrogenase [bacterium]|nr:dihydroorotate dehydrogenase [bacterium]
MKLSIQLGNLVLENPIIIASGVFSPDSASYFPIEAIGAIITKTVTPRPREGNPPPRLLETAAGLINSIGLQNVGIERFIEEELPRYMELGVPIIVSISGETEADFPLMAERLRGKGIAGIELNLSCPNVQRGGMHFGRDAETVFRIVREVKDASSLWVMPKLTPQARDIVETALAGEEGGADAISLVNTFLAMAIDIRARSSRLGTLMGGLSGPAIKPIALRMVYEVARAVRIPVVGCGGIMNAEDALEFLIAGASAVEIGTACLINPSIPAEILDGIRKFMEEEGIDDIRELIGSLKIKPLDI